MRNAPLDTACRSAIDGARVSAFTAMPVADELAALLAPRADRP